eukprot:COSAG02_NODE_3864_length_6127_cov_2.330624_4_plen_117_part_01
MAVFWRFQHRASTPCSTPINCFQHIDDLFLVSESVDLLYTNTGAVDLVLASDAAGKATWIKEVKSTRLQPGMRLVSMEVYDPKTKRLAPRDLAGLPFLDAVKEVEAQSITGTEGGIS